MPLLPLFLLVTLLHALINPHYGFFRDELYFIVCGRHPALGYVDQPPLIPLLAALTQTLGTSLTALRLLPALAAGASAAASAAIAIELGGSTFAALLAATATTLAPILIAFGTIWTPDSIQIAAWPWLVWLLLRARTDPRAWPAAGLLLGLALQAKYSAAMAALALATGLLVTTPRLITQRGPWIAASLAASIALPNLLWQAAHGVPMLELLRNGQLGKNVTLTPADFLAQQILLTNPVLAPLWLAGLAHTATHRHARFLAIGFAALLALMIALHGKSYYPTPIYPALFGAGAAAIQIWTRRAPNLRWLLAPLAIPALALAPLTAPVLPEPAMAAYLASLRAHGIGAPATENHRMPPLDQVYADMHGWPELAAQVASLRVALPPDIQARTYIFASNYGEASAVAVFAPALAPFVISGHNQYWLWGPRGWDGTALIDIGGDLETDRRLCNEARRLAVTHSEWGMPYEDNRQIILCTGLRTPVPTIWPKLKHFD